MARIKPPSSPKNLEVFFCPFLEERNFRNEKSMVQYPRSYQWDKWNIEKEQNTNHTQVSQTCISKTNLIFFYGRCRVVHHALFLQVRQRAVASFLNPRLNEKPRNVHLYCALMAYRMLCALNPHKIRIFNDLKCGKWWFCPPFSTFFYYQRMGKRLLQIKVERVS